MMDNEWWFKDVNDDDTVLFISHFTKCIQRDNTQMYNCDVLTYPSMTKRYGYPKRNLTARALEGDKAHETIIEES